MNIKISKLNGFSLVELLITLAIIAVIAALALFGSQGVREQGRDARRKSDLETIRSALETYRSDCTDYPTAGAGVGQLSFGGSLRGDGTPATTCPNTNFYAQTIPLDPQNPSRVYYYNRTSTTTYDLCARLEQAPNPAMAMGTCGNNCGGGQACNYRVTAP